MEKVCQVSDLVSPQIQYAQTVLGKPNFSDLNTLNEKIAVFVFGWCKTTIGEEYENLRNKECFPTTSPDDTVVWVPGDSIRNVYEDGNTFWLRSVPELPNYTTDINDAVKIYQFMKSRGFTRVTTETPDYIKVVFQRKKSLFEGISATEPLAACKAAISVIKKSLRKG